MNFDFLQVFLEFDRIIIANRRNRKRRGGIKFINHLEWKQYHLSIPETSSIIIIVIIFWLVSFSSCCRPDVNVLLSSCYVTTTRRRNLLLLLLPAKFLSFFLLQHHPLPQRRKLWEMKNSYTLRPPASTVIYSFHHLCLPTSAITASWNTFIL